MPGPSQRSSAAIAVLETQRRHVPLSPLLDSYDHVVLDLDGCVWVGDVATPRAPEAIAALRGEGKSLAFVTNDSRHSPEEYVRKLWSIGIRASLEEVVTAGAAIQYLLAALEPKAGVYVIGSSAIFRHVTEAGHHVVNGTDSATRAEMVVVAGHDELSYAELREATQAVLAGAEMIAADRDRTFPAEDGQWPGTGAIVAALEYATERDAEIVGKPEPQLMLTALDRLGPGSALVVGDKIDADLAAARAAGLDGAIVLTGVSTRAEVSDAKDPKPVAIAEDLYQLVVGS